MPLSGIPNYKA